MLPSVWFYIALVALSWGLLLYLKLRSRSKRHVKGCTSLPYISPERLDSLIVIESDLIIVELSSRADCSDIPQIPDSHRVPIDQLESFLREASHRSVFVFYDTPSEPAMWDRVEAILNHYPIHYVFVLKGGLQAWLSRQQARAMAVVS